MDNTDKEDFVILSRFFLGLALIGISNKIGNSNPPFSIIATPILIPVICLGLNSRIIKRSFKLFVIIGYALLIVNDLLIRAYAGGIHDAEGKGFVLLCSFLAFIILTIGYVIYYNNKVKN